MKKIIKLSLITVLLFMGTACGNKNDNQDNNKQQNQSPIEETLDNETITKQGDIELTNVKITANGSINTITATIKNNGTTTKTFDAVLYLKNENNLILGKVGERIDKLGSKQSKDISIEIMGDYTTVKTYELIIENLINQ